MSKTARERMGMVQKILSERTRQDVKWGEQNHTDLGWLAILTEEVGEVARCNCHTSLGEAEEQFKEMWEESTDDELVQVAAVALAWLECRARRREQQS